MTGYEEAVRGYLRDCMRAAAQLDAKGSALRPEFHPTEAGAVKLIFHNGGKAAAAQIRQAFREITGEGGTGG